MAHIFKIGDPQGETIPKIPERLTYMDTRWLISQRAVATSPASIPRSSKAVAH